jgi:hypothetical protein
MPRELLTIRVLLNDDGGMTTELDANNRFVLGDMARAFAQVRLTIRRTVGDVEKQFNCGGAFSLLAQKHFMRLLMEGPAAEQTLIQEVPSDE